MPKHGPSDGSRSATDTRLPMRFNPSASPTDTVVLPMPAFVAVIAVTRISLLFFTFASSTIDKGSLAIYLP